MLTELTINPFDGLSPRVPLFPGKFTHSIPHLLVSVYDTGETLGGITHDIKTNTCIERENAPLESGGVRWLFWRQHPAILH